MNSSADLLPPVDIAPARHKWGHPVTVIKGNSGCQETHRVCEFCGMTKITIHSPENRAWREWLPRNSEVQFIGERTPRCRPSAAIAEVPVR